jgi:hypothetical protein
MDAPFVEGESNSLLDVLPTTTAPRPTACCLTNR